MPPQATGLQTAQSGEGRRTSGITLLAGLFLLSTGMQIATGATVKPVSPLLAPAIANATKPAAPRHKVTSLDDRLAGLGLKRGAPVLLRIFKEESELELWLQDGDRFKRLATYPICRWRGALGPKLTEGDRQSPEGFYSFGQDQLLWQGHWFRAFNINYPNTFDQALGRTGSGILIHGACSSIGCYAMTDPIIDEMFDLIVAAFASGQQRVPVHIYPFHMTLANLARHDKSPWMAFWRDLKPASDLFVATQIPPRIGVCDGRYVVRPGQSGSTDTSRIADWCGAMTWIANADRMVQQLDRRRATAEPPAAPLAVKLPSERIQLYARLASEGRIPKPQTLPSRPVSYGPSPDIAGKNPSEPLVQALGALPAAERAAILGVRAPGAVAASIGGGSAETGGPVRFSCNAALAACKHFMAAHGNRSVAQRSGKAKVAKK